MSERATVTRECTCLGTCKGPEGLAPGWRCALVRSPECRDNRRRMHEGEARRVAKCGHVAYRDHELDCIEDGCPNAAYQLVPCCFCDDEAACVKAGKCAQYERSLANCVKASAAPAPVPAVEGEPPEMTFSEAMAALARGEAVECFARSRDEWEPVPPNAGTTLLNVAKVWATQRYRLKPRPAPALTRVQEMASKGMTDKHGNLVIVGVDAVEFTGRIVRMYGTRLLQLIDGPAVEAFKRALEQAEREFLGPGEGR